jgi:hypothetical protein
MANDPHIRSYTTYVDTIGRYGGGDTASGRMKAKSRAITKAFQCSWYEFSEGKLGPHWSAACGVNPVDADIKVRPDKINFIYFEEILRDRWCATARDVALQFNISGPVYLTSDVLFFGDASGTEADTQLSLGKVNQLVCW